MTWPPERFAALSCAFLVAATPALGQDAAPEAQGSSTVVTPVDVVATRGQDMDMSACESSIINDPDSARRAAAQVVEVRDPS